MNIITTVFTRFYAQITPRGRGIIVLLAFILLFAIATGEGVLYRLSYFLALGIAGSYAWAWLNLWRLDMQMHSKSYVVQVGDMLEGYVYVQNNSPLPTSWVEIVQMSDMPGYVSSIATTIPGRGRERLETKKFSHARGVYTIGPLVARSSDPLGLFRVQITQGDQMKVVVQPSIVTLPYFRLPKAELSGEESIQHRSQTRTPHVATVREYIHCDSLNRIHWPSTAKCGQLMSKEFDSGGGGNVWIVLDLERKIHQSQGTERTDEYAVAIAASLTNLALVEERSVGLIAYGDKEYVLPLRSGTKQMSKVLETLTLSKTEGYQDLGGVLSQNAVQFGRSASLLVITSSVTVEWISVLKELRYRGLNIVVVLVDPTSFGGKQSIDEVVMELVNVGIPAYVVRRGDPIPYALSQPITLHDLPIVEQPSKPTLITASEM